MITSVDKYCKQPLITLKSYRNSILYHPGGLGWNDTNKFVSLSSSFKPEHNIAQSRLQRITLLLLDRKRWVAGAAVVETENVEPPAKDRDREIEAQNINLNTSFSSLHGWGSGGNLNEVSHIPRVDLTWPHAITIMQMSSTKLNSSIRLKPISLAVYMKGGIAKLCRTRH